MPAGTGAVWLRALALSSRPKLGPASPIVASWFPCMWAVVWLIAAHLHTHHCRDFGPYPVQYRGAAAPTEPNSCAGSCPTAHTMQTNNARGALNSTTCPRFRTISQPSLCDPAHMFILPHAVQTWTLTPFPMDSSLASHYFCSACRISSQMSSLVLGHSIVTLTRTALDTLAESALVRPSRSTNEPVDKFFMERLSRPFPWVAPRACATSARLTAR